ncbi:uncharacterized protein QYS62_003894 [Fusarium acuminatum]|uniref:Uncharacterized protein n=1 Tax=Fusarium acuminatum TaxID=5515 RepID=A0ABZ2WQR2_9HYPO
MGAQEPVYTQMVPEQPKRPLAKSLTPDRVSILTSPEDVEDNNELLAMKLESSEASVENFFRDNVVPRSSHGDILRRSYCITVSKDTAVSKMPNFEISTSIPDMLYGYNRSNAFGEAQQIWIAATGISAWTNH